MRAGPVRQAPRLRKGRRKRRTIRVDPLHYETIRAVARDSGLTENCVTDGILMEYFKSYSPRYGDPIGGRRGRKKGGGR